MRVLRLIAIQAAVVVVLLEVALRIYNPLPFRTRGSRFVLPVHKKYVLHNDGARKLDPVVYHTKNSLGFRGPDPAPDFARRFTVFVIGASTTECMFLSDGKTWPDVLARRLAAVRPDVWVNNAGMDGQSTYGHLVLLNDFIIAMHPKMAVFLIGGIDIGLGRENPFDQSLRGGSLYLPAFDGAHGRLHDAWVFLTNHSEIAAAVENFRRGRRAQNAGFTSLEMDFTALTPRRIDEPVIRARLEALDGPLRGYEQRVSAIVAVTRANGITPVLLTQPLLVGDAIDPATGVDLSTVPLDSDSNGALVWRQQERYNDVTRRVAGERQVPLVDAARLMPKDSRYFYDRGHLTNAGAERLGGIVADGVEPLLRAR
jgi:lysophospholipase L1-like esterase